MSAAGEGKEKGHQEHWGGLLRNQGWVAGVLGVACRGYWEVEEEVLSKVGFEGSRNWVRRGRGGRNDARGGQVALRGTRAACSTRMWRPGGCEEEVF